jgi:hypothetical protein
MQNRYKMYDFTQMTSRDSICEAGEKRRAPCYWAQADDQRRKTLDEW